MSYEEILYEIREYLDIRIKDIAVYSEPTDYHAGRKTAYEDVANMIDNYIYGKRKEEEDAE